MHRPLLRLVTPSASFVLVCALSAPLFGCSEEDEGPLLGTGGTSNGAGSAGRSGAVAGQGPLTFGGFGSGGGSPGSGGAGGGDCNPKVIGLLRDFQAAHPNFENTIATEKGIVAPDLGPDKKPVFAGVGLRTVTTAEDFNQWYRDTPGINQSMEHQIVFQPAADGRGVYDNPAFFPLDGLLFGDEGEDHNFHFTFELHMEFRYRGGEVFEFRGDDDLFVFINNKLALDLGGVHGPLPGSVDLDEMAAELGIAAGNTYPLDFFHAERHTSQSNFHVETNLEFTNCVPIIVR